MEVEFGYQNINAVAELFCEVFGDSVSYINILRNTGFLNPENTYAVVDNNVLISALITPIYTMRWNEQEWDCPYICYICTRKSFQGKGYATHLIQATIKDLKSRGYCFTTLIPANDALFNFYQQFGFQDMFYADILSYEPLLVNKNFFALNIWDRYKVDSYYNIYYERYSDIPFCIMKSFDLFYGSVVENGQVFTDGESIIFTTEGKRSVLVRDYGGTPDFQSFCDFLQKPLSVYIPGNSERIGMGLVLDYSKIDNSIYNKIGFMNGMFN